MKNKPAFSGKPMTTVIPVFVFVAATLMLSSFERYGNKNFGVQGNPKGLKDYYINFFPIGVAIAPNNLEGDQAELIKQNFNSLTAENVMKPALIHPEENRYSWENAERIVKFAQENGMKVRGHTLCWHNQTAAWMFKDSLGNQVSRDLALARLKDHIITVVSHFKGKVYAWDVLNEAVVDDKAIDKIFRESNWYRICGEEYIPKVFQWAHEADPDAILFYNDYNTEDPVKRDKIYNLLKRLLEQHVPVHGVGLQGHWNINGPSERNIREAIEKFSSLGLKVQITELDVSVITSGADTVKTYTPEREQKQADFYKMAFGVFREKKNVITGVTFWNVSDRRSWLDRPDRKSFPLLFDVNLKPKKAFTEVVRF